MHPVLLDLRLYFEVKIRYNLIILMLADDWHDDDDAATRARTKTMQPEITVSERTVPNMVGPELPGPMTARPKAGGPKTVERRTVGFKTANLTGCKNGFKNGSLRKQRGEGYCNE